MFPTERNSGPGRWRNTVLSFPMVVFAFHFRPQYLGISSSKSERTWRCHF